MVPAMSLKGANEISGGFDCGAGLMISMRFMSREVEISNDEF